MNLGRGVVGGYFFAKRELGETPDNTRLRLFPTLSVVGCGEGHWYFLLRRAERPASAPLVPSLSFGSVVKAAGTSSESKSANRLFPLPLFLAIGGVA